MERPAARQHPTWLTERDCTERGNVADQRPGDNGVRILAARSVSPVRCSDPVGVSARPLDQVNPIAIRVDDPRRSKAVRPIRRARLVGDDAVGGELGDSGVHGSTADPTAPSRRARHELSRDGCGQGGLGGVSPAIGEAALWLERDDRSPATVHGLLLSGLRHGSSQVPVTASNPGPTGADPSLKPSACSAAAHSAASENGRPDPSVRVAPNAGSVTPFGTSGMPRGRVWARIMGRPFAGTARSPRFLATPLVASFRRAPHWRAPESR